MKYNFLVDDAKVCEKKPSFGRHMYFGSATVNFIGRKIIECLSSEYKDVARVNEYKVSCVLRMLYDHRVETNVNTNLTIDDYNDMIDMAVRFTTNISLRGDFIRFVA